jgi:flagellar basal body-associated protein FliL
MSSKTKWIIIILVILVIALAVVGIAYMTTRKAITGPSGAPSAPPAQGEVSTSPKMGRFDLGEFIATSRDEELHYVKIQVEVGYIGNLEQELEERKAELREALSAQRYRN